MCKNNSQNVLLFETICVSLQRLSKLKEIDYKSTTKKLEKQMANKIIADWGLRSKIMSVFKTTYPTVREALNGSDSTKLRRNIRGYALRNGGAELK